MDNYFDFFGLPLTFFVDKDALRKKFLENSRKFHPDIAKRGEDSATSPEEASSKNNEGFKILKDFYQTMAYILRLKGKLITGEKEKLDMEFLGEMMDINEGLMELEMEFDNEVFNRLDGESKDRLSTIEASLKNHAKQYDNTQDDAILDQIKEEYLKRKYLLRIRDSIDKFAAS
jgi:molecular chaperone HscB